MFPVGTMALLNVAHKLVLLFVFAQAVLNVAFERVVDLMLQFVRV
jgi:hypothetical protein